MSIEWGNKGAGKRERERQGEQRETGACLSPLNNRLSIIFYITCAAKSPHTYNLQSTFCVNYHGLSSNTVEPLIKDTQIKNPLLKGQIYSSQFLLYQYIITSE